MVGILVDNDDFYFVKWVQIEGVEYKFVWWVNSGSLVFVFYKFSEFDKVIFFKFGCQMLFLVFFYLYVYGIFFIIKCVLKIGVICKNDK